MIMEPLDNMAVLAGIDRAALPWLPKTAMHGAKTSHLHIGDTGQRFRRRHCAK